MHLSNRFPTYTAAYTFLHFSRLGNNRERKKKTWANDIETCGSQVDKAVHHFVWTGGCLIGLHTHGIVCANIHTHKVSSGLFPRKTHATTNTVLYATKSTGPLKLNECDMLQKQKNDLPTTKHLPADFKSHNYQQGRSCSTSW
jgi:hypothetical protein